MANKKGSSFYSAPLAKRKFNFSEAEESTFKEIDSIRVYLRVKPYDEERINEGNNVFEVADSSTLLVKPSRKFSTRNEEHRYTFTHIFASDVGQQEVFEKSVKDSVVDFINGFSSLIFSYGTTNAGKTFTVQGTTQKPGLIPRALYLVFNSIEERQTNRVEYMPCGRLVKRMSEQELKNHAELKQIVLNSGHTDESQSTSKAVQKSCLLSKECEFDFKILDVILEKETEAFAPLKPDSTYSLWISFFEIYNECIYDLLTPPLTANSQRKQLKIGEDAAKNVFIKELNYVNVTSVQDALKVLFYGRNNLQVAMTGLNANSSRSHCIFTLTLVCSPNAAETGEEIVISQLSLCDLAGTERQKKTLNAGERLKESQHINCSLHVLSRCFDIIRENQNKADKSVIPYRESKLTKLFQKALRGEEKILMLVNINLAISFDDTHQVLKTSAIARKTTCSIKPSQQTKRRSRSMMFRRSLAEHSRNKPMRSVFSSPAAMVCATLTEENDDDDDYDDDVDVSNVHGHSQQIVESLLSTIDSQKKKLATFKCRVQELEEANASLEDDLRAELGVEYGKLIKTIEDRLKKRIDEKSSKIAEQDRVIAELQRRVNCEVDCENGGSSRKKRKVFDCSLSMIEAANASRVSDADVLREENNLLKNDLSSLKSTLAYYKNENMELNKKYSEMKLLRRIENIATLREAVVDEDIQKVLEEMDRMKEQFEAVLSKRNALIKEAMDEMKHLEDTYNEVISDNGKLEGELLVAKEELNDVKRTLAIANEISAKKTEENQEMEVKLEKLEGDNEKLNDYIELAEAEIKCLKQKLMCIGRNQTQSADIFDDDSIELNEQYDEVFRGKFQPTHQESLNATHGIDENSQNILCKELQKVSLEFGTSGGEEEVNSELLHPSSIDSMTMSITKQSVKHSLQPSVSYAKASDTFVNSKSKSLGESSAFNTIDSTPMIEVGNHTFVSNANKYDSNVNSVSKSLGESSAFSKNSITKIEVGNQTFASNANKYDSFVTSESKSLGESSALTKNSITKIEVGNQTFASNANKYDSFVNSKSKSLGESSALTKNSITKIEVGNQTFASNANKYDSFVTSESKSLGESSALTKNSITKIEVGNQTFASNANKYDSFVTSESKSLGESSALTKNSITKIEVGNQTFASNANKYDSFVTCKSKSLGEYLAYRTIDTNSTIEGGNQTSEIEKEEGRQLKTELEVEMEQKIIEMTNEFEKIKQHNCSLLQLVDQYKEEKMLLENKVSGLTENRDKLENDKNLEILQLADEISNVNRSNLSLKSLIEQAETEKMRLQEELRRLKDERVPESEYQQKLSQMSLEIEEIKKFHSTTVNLLENFEEEKALFQVTIEKLGVVTEKQEQENKQLKDTIQAKDLEVQQLLAQRESALESNRELENKIKNVEKVCSELEEMALTLKTSNDKLLICNREYAEKNKQLIEELESKNETCVSQLQKMNDLEEGLMNEIATTKSRNREFAEENKQLLEERESLLQKLNNLEANHEHLMNEVATKESCSSEYAEKIKHLETDLKSKNEKCESLLQKLNDLEANHECLMNEMDTTKSSNREYVDNNKQLIEELKLKNEKYESLLQKLNDLEADHERLMNDVDTSKSSNREFAAKNKQLIEELKLKNEEYESLLQKLNDQQANHERLMNVVDTKTSRLHQVEIELSAAKKDLEMKTEEILKLHELSRTRKSAHIPSISKSKSSRSEDSDEDDVFIMPSCRKNNENLPPANTKAERISRNKTGIPTQVKALSTKRTPKRITRSAVSTQAQSTKSVSSPPHAQILKNLQAEQSCDSTAAAAGSSRRRLLTQPNAISQIPMEEFPDDPQVDNESPVSILNRLTGTPSAQRKLRPRRKREF